MRLRDVELDVALLLQSAGVGSLADGAPTLFAGPYPASAPDAMAACRHAGAERPEKYLAKTGRRLHREAVTVLVRGARGPEGYVESGTRARAAWAALFELRPDGYVTVDTEDGAPTYVGLDEAQRPQWTFTVGLEYVSATAPGVVVPLSKDATMRVSGGVEVAALGETAAAEETPEVRALAVWLHTALCPDDHATLQCRWFVEDPVGADSLEGADWTAAHHVEWLLRARGALATAKRLGWRLYPPGAVEPLPVTSNATS